MLGCHLVLLYRTADKYKQFCQPLEISSNRLSTYILRSVASVVIKLFLVCICLFRKVSLCLDHKPQKHFKSVGGGAPSVIFSWMKRFFIYFRTTQIKATWEFVNCSWCFTRHNWKKIWGSLVITVYRSRRRR